MAAFFMYEEILLMLLFSHVLANKEDGSRRLFGDDIKESAVGMEYNALRLVWNSRCFGHFDDGDGGSFRAFLI